MFSKLSKYKIKLFSTLVVIVLLIGTHFAAYRAGVDRERAKDADRITDYQKKVAKLKQQLVEEQNNIKVEYREREVKIEQAEDACADQPASPTILDQLRNDSN